MDIKNKINTVLLCDIAIHLGIDTDLDPEIVKYAITSGQDWILDAKYSGAFSEGSEKAERDFVVELLYAYRGLSKSYRLLSLTEQAELKKKHRLNIIDDNIQLPASMETTNMYTKVSSKHSRKLIASLNKISLLIIPIHIQCIITMH